MGLHLVSKRKGGGEREREAIDSFPGDLEISQKVFSLLLLTHTTIAVLLSLKVPIQNGKCAKTFAIHCSRLKHCVCRVLYM